MTWKEVVVIMIAVLVCVIICMTIYDGCMDGSIPLANNTMQGGCVVRVVDGCEYLDNLNGAMTHKGNCKNPVHFR